MTRIFKSSHDVAGLGVLTAAGNPPRKLASMADLVRHMICCEALPDLPLRAAAAKVLDTLAAANPLPDLYLTDSADFACPITPETLLRAGRVGREGGTTRQLKTGWSATSWGPNKSQYRDVKFPAQSAIAERRGVPGLLDELREAWCINARSVADLDKGRPPRVAIAYDVAAALFGLVAASSGDLFTQAALSPAIVGAAITAGPGQVAPLLAEGEACATRAICAAPIVGQAAAALPADAVVLAEWEKLNRAAGKKKPTADLMTRYACSADTIQRACKRARDAAAAVTAAAGTATNPFGITTKRAA